MQFIAQPFAKIRLGEFLLSHLADLQWTAFRAAVAFIKRSGMQHIRQPLLNFSDRAQVRISVGIDLYGTSREALSDLLEATPHGQIFVYRNNGPYTFHPKVYLFKSDHRADVVVGSGNMTGGGLFTNYEDTPATTPPTRLFISTTVPPPPPIAQPTAEAEAAELPSATLLSPPGIVLLSAGGVSSFVMTLQNTDVGVGQTTAGTSRRSPEVFIPLAALDQNPGFWTFPTQFTADRAWNRAHPAARRNRLGKMDRMGVPMRIGVVQSVRMFFNPRKGDFRLGSEALRSSGHIGDILLVRRVDPVNGFEYDIQVAPQGSPLFQQLAPFCNMPTPNSDKLFGYF